MRGGTDRDWAGKVTADGRGSHPEKKKRGRFIWESASFLYEKYFMFQVVFLDPGRKWQRSIKKYYENTNLCQVNGK